MEGTISFFLFAASFWRMSIGGDHVGQGLKYVYVMKKTDSFIIFLVNIHWQSPVHHHPCGYSPFFRLPQSLPAFSLAGPQRGH